MTSDESISLTAPTEVSPVSKRKSRVRQTRVIAAQDAPTNDANAVEAEAVEMPGSTTVDCTGFGVVVAVMKRDESLKVKLTPEAAEPVIEKNSATEAAPAKSNEVYATPRRRLLPYQERWMDDASRFKIGLWARQTGKSFACAGEAVTHAMRSPKAEWVVLSAGERQALEFMRKGREWAECFNFAISDYVERRDSAEAMVKSAEITWANGSRMLALPANPDTARGYSANLILDEFAFHENPDEIWRAIYPSISNSLRGKKKIRIVSTANGRANKFYDLWNRNPHYSRHKITIHDAVAQGLPMNVEELRAGLNDPEGWTQEYECEFIDSAAILLPYDLIATCEEAEASEAAGAEFFEAKRSNPIYCGIDFGRKQDLTVCWTLELVNGVLWTREVFVLEKKSTPEQVELLRPRIAHARRTCLDYTGPGVGLGDYLAREFGEHNAAQHKNGRIELCQFSSPLKAELFPKLRTQFEARQLRIPISRAVREDLHGIQRVTTPNGQVSYRAPQTAGGHSDRCTALALAVRAAESKRGGFAFESAPFDRRAGGLPGRN